MILHTDQLAGLQLFLLFQSSGVNNFFARKFESIISHEIIRELDAHLFGAYPAGTPGLYSYWESLYHSEDDITQPGDSSFTLYMSLSRLIGTHFTKYAAHRCCKLVHHVAMATVFMLTSKWAYSF